jgi:DNA polymerase-3 subunit chi
MTEVRFYHLQTKAPEQALPAILAKALEQGRRVVIRLPDMSAAQRLDEFLWVWNPDSFLPHGVRGDKDGGADQPVWLTDGDDNPNGATVLILTGGAPANDIGAYDLCCEMLDGRDAASVESARARWSDYKAQGFATTYWQQNEKGGWVQKG